MTKNSWQTTMGLSEETTRVYIYAYKTWKEDWEHEAEQNGRSLSEYLQQLIQEARFQRSEGKLEIGDRHKVKALQQKVDELQSQVDKQGDTSTSAEKSGQAVPENLLLEALTENYRQTDDLVDQLLESEAFRQHLQLQLESQLFELGNRGDAVYRRGKGWKHGGDQ